MTTTQLTSLVHGANEVVTFSEDGYEVHENAAIAVVDGKIEKIGPTSEITSEYPPENADYPVDATNKSVVPGFVDPHTHALFAGDRSDEFEAKLRGKTYQEILAEGGGILRTVKSTREATNQDLLDNLLGHLNTMLAHGTTTVEVKSGYGLDTDTELRMLEVMAEADEKHPIDVVPTFMGAHAVPQERDADEYTDEVVEEQIPAVADQGIAEFCDVFCEEDVFTVDQSRRVLEAGKSAGLKPKIHAEEFTRIGGAQLGAEVGAVSADHLLHANEDDVRALTEAGVSPVMLPGTAFVLGTEYADAQAFLDAGAPLAIATDFNPNCYSHSMGFAVSLACIGMKLTPIQALRGATINSARSLDRDNVGTLREGSQADMVVLDAPSYVHVPYNFAVNTVDTVLKDGEVVHEN